MPSKDVEKLLEIVSNRRGQLDTFTDRVNERVAQDFQEHGEKPPRYKVNAGHLRWAIIELVDMLEDNQS